MQIEVEIMPIYNDRHQHVWAPYVWLRHHDPLIPPAIVAHYFPTKRPSWRGWKSRKSAQQFVPTIAARWQVVLECVPSEQWYFVGTTGRFRRGVLEYQCYVGNCKAFRAVYRTPWMSDQDKVIDLAADVAAKFNADLIYSIQQKRNLPT